MSHPNLLSRLSTRLAPSGIRKLEQLAKDMPGLISLGPGQPDGTLFPSTEIVSALSAVFDNPDAAALALQYGQSQGNPELLALLAQHMLNRGVTCDASNILVTAGAQQAIDLITQLLVDDGDSVLVQPYTYPGALQVFRARGAKVASLADQDDSMRGSETKFIYAMTDFQNPTGEVLSVDERAALLATARRRGTFLVEDSPYREIRFSDRDLPPTLLEMDCSNASPDTGRTLFVGSFSKVIAPGLRVGWIVGPANVISLLTLLRQGSDLQPGTLSQEIVVNLLKHGIDEHVARVRRRYQERRDAMLNALQAHLHPYATWNAPEGGFFVWVKLSVPIDARELLDKAIENGVAYVPGSEFHHDAHASSSLRLSFSTADPQLMDEAIRRLADTIAAAIKNTTSD
ncbi:PLP-dependent aminotransferase family protein [Paraburkholderia nemoris]|uniref:aminotransferase-like domain-containing protein n=1 Tax=Paraburkholderia nemoris TaxID=2793076 RepID=UPI0038B7AB1B